MVRHVRNLPHFRGMCMCLGLVACPLIQLTEISEIESDRERWSKGNQTWNLDELNKGRSHV